MRPLADGARMDMADSAAGQASQPREAAEALRVGARRASSVICHVVGTAATGGGLARDAQVIMRSLRCVL